METYNNSNVRMTESQSADCSDDLIEVLIVDTECEHRDLTHKMIELAVDGGARLMAVHLVNELTLQKKS